MHIVKVMVKLLQISAAAQVHELVEASFFKVFVPTQTLIVAAMNESGTKHTMECEGKKRSCVTSASVQDGDILGDNRNENHLRDEGHETGRREGIEEMDESHLGRWKQRFQHGCWFTRKFVWSATTLGTRCIGEESGL